MDVPDPLPLRNISVPAEVTAVAGCNCGGTTMHHTDCTIWSMPHEEAMAAVEAAEGRIREFTAALNAKLRAALP